MRRGEECIAGEEGKVGGRGSVRLKEERGGDGESIGIPTDVSRPASQPAISQPAS